MVFINSSKSVPYTIEHLSSHDTYIVKVATQTPSLLSSQIPSRHKIASAMMFMFSIITKIFGDGTVHVRTEVEWLVAVVMWLLSFFTSRLKDIVENPYNDDHHHTIIQ